MSPSAVVWPTQALCDRCCTSSSDQVALLLQYDYLMMFDSDMPAALATKYPNFAVRPLPRPCPCPAAVADAGPVVLWQKLVSGTRISGTHTYKLNTLGVAARSVCSTD